MKEDKLYNIGDYGNSSFVYYYKIDKSKNSSWESMDWNEEWEKVRELRLQREKAAAREVKIDLILKK
jgi:hypothetical protein